MEFDYASEPHFEPARQPERIINFLLALIVIGERFIAPAIRSCWDTLLGSFLALVASLVLAGALFHFARQQPSSHHVLLGQLFLASLVLPVVFFWRYCAVHGSRSDQQKN